MTRESDSKGTFNQNQNTEQDAKFQPIKEQDSRYKKQSNGLAFKMALFHFLDNRKTFFPN